MLGNIRLCHIFTIIGLPYLVNSLPLFCWNRPPNDTDVMHLVEWTFHWAGEDPSKMQNSVCAVRTLLMLDLVPPVWLFKRSLVKAIVKLGMECSLIHPIVAAIA